MQLNVMSFNICCWGEGENTYEKRMPRVKAIINKYKPDTLGVQEATTAWMEYLNSELDDYASVGIGREGGNKGEHTAIFYRKDKLSLIDTDTFWLSETPRQVSKSWGASYLRVCTWARLKIAGSDKEFEHINTHLDFGELAPIKQSQMILDTINSFRIPVICTGDFNYTEDAEGYKLLTVGKMGDSRYLAKETMNIATYHDYGHVDISMEKPIDFCFVSKDDFQVISYKVINELVEGKHYSDHFALFVNLMLA